MGEKTGGLFLMMVVVVIAGIIIAGVHSMYPDFLDQIKTGLLSLLKSGFDSAQSTGFINFLGNTK